MGLHVGLHHIVTLHCVLFGEVVWRGGTDVLHVGAETDGVFAGSSFTCAVMALKLPNRITQMVKIAFFIGMFFCLFSLV